MKKKSILNIRKSTVKIFQEHSTVERLTSLIKTENKSEKQIADIKEMLEEYEEIVKYFEGLPDAAYT